jgi:hypothetical protein
VVVVRVVLVVKDLLPLLVVAAEELGEYHATFLVWQVSFPRQLP